MYVWRAIWKSTYSVHVQYTVIEYGVPVLRIITWRYLFEYNALYSLVIMIHAQTVFVCKLEGDIFPHLFSYTYKNVQSVLES